MTEHDARLVAEPQPVSVVFSRDEIEAKLAASGQFEYWLGQIASASLDYKDLVRCLDDSVDNIFAAFGLSAAEWAKRVSGFRSSPGGPNVLQYGMNEAQTGGMRAGAFLRYFATRSVEGQSAEDGEGSAAMGFSLADSIEVEIVGEGGSWVDRTYYHPESGQTLLSGDHNDLINEALQSDSGLQLVATTTNYSLCFRAVFSKLGFVAQTPA